MAKQLTSADMATIVDRAPVTQVMPIQNGIPTMPVPANVQSLPVPPQAPASLQP